MPVSDPSHSLSPWRWATRASRAPHLGQASCIGPPTVALITVALIIIGWFRVPADRMLHTRGESFSQPVANCASPLNLQAFNGGCRKKLARGRSDKYLKRGF